MKWKMTNPGKAKKMMKSKLLSTENFCKVSKKKRKNRKKRI